MKIGLSYSRCVLDIVEGRVNINDVLVVIARTDFDPNIDEQWVGIWAGYADGGMWNMNLEWGETAHTEEEFRDVSINLWNQGKLHQPRKFGAHATRRPEFWLETCLPSEELERNVAAKDAWDRFQVVAGLANVGIDKEYK